MSQTPSELHEAHRLVEEALNQAGVSPMAIFLFGSRARGQARSAVGVDGRPPLRVALAGIPADVILLPQPRFLRYKDDVGHIVYYTVREGCMIGLDANLSPEEHNENLRTHGHDSQAGFASARIPAGVCMEP